MKINVFKYLNRVQSRGHSEVVFLRQRVFHENQCNNFSDVMATDKETDKQMNRRTGGQTDGRTDRQTDRRTDGRTDGRRD